MLGLYIIAFGAPLLVFGPLALFIRRITRRAPTFFESPERAMGLFVVAPLAISYGLLTLAAVWLGVDWLLRQ